MIGFLGCLFFFSKIFILLLYKLQFINEKVAVFSFIPELAMRAGELYMKSISLSYMSFVVIMVVSLTKKLSNETQQYGDLLCI